MRKLVWILVLGLVVGCAGVVKSPDQMTSKEKATYVMSLYNNAYENYNIQFSAATRPFSQEMTTYFQGYKKVMENAWPVISLYSSIAQTNGTPSQDQEQMILKMIYQFQAILMKGAK